MSASSRGDSKDAVGSFEFVSHAASVVPSAAADVEAGASSNEAAWTCSNKSLRLMFRKRRVIFRGFPGGELEGVFPVTVEVVKDESMEFILELPSRGRKNPCPLSEFQDKDPIEFTEFTELLESCLTRRGLVILFL